MDGELAGARIDLLDLDAGTLRIESTRVVVDGKVIESDGKTQTLSTCSARPVYPSGSQVARGNARPGAQALRPGLPRTRCPVLLGNGLPPHPDTITRRFKKLSRDAGLPDIDLHDVRRSYLTAGRKARIDWKALSKRVGHADVTFTMRQYVETDLQADREVANTLAKLIIGGSLASLAHGGEPDSPRPDDEHEDQGNADPAACAPRLQIRLQTICKRPVLCSRTGLCLGSGGRI